jgi:succinate dehydrogenase / fumarate reductase iron-sulfur subunit
MNLKLHVWRQNSPDEKGHFETYDAKDVLEDMSFLEMLDVVNDGLEAEGREPIAFESDCREGICGACGCMINGQLHMREFSDGDEIVIEPFRAKAFPVIKDLVVDRSSFDRIIQSGGFITARTGSAPDANAIPVAKVEADRAFDAATCIGCGACVASCPNAAAMLFTGAKVTHLGLLPQGQPERFIRVDKMVTQMDSEDFGHCTNFGECTLACPKSISLDVISQMNSDYMKAQFKSREV